MRLDDLLARYEDAGAAKKDLRRAGFRPVPKFRYMVRRTNGLLEVWKRDGTRYYKHAEYRRSE